MMAAWNVGQADAWLAILNLWLARVWPRGLSTDTAEWHAHEHAVDAAYLAKDQDGLRAACHAFYDWAKSVAASQQRPYEGDTDDR